MKWAVVSDIHGNLPALQAVWADVARIDGTVDGWLNLGDIVSGPLWPAETADWLMSRPAGEGWLTMAGNHERQLLTLPIERMGDTDRQAAERLTQPQRDWLAALPARLQPQPGLLCVHGTPASDLVYLLETVTPTGLREASEAELAERLAGLAGLPQRTLTPPRLLLCGHSHLPRDRVFGGPLGGLRLANPGSVGLPAYDDDHPWPHVVENGSPAARYAVVEQLAGRWHVALRAVDYDFEAAARQAEARGRGDWVDALRSGRVGRREAEVLAGRAAGA